MAGNLICNRHGQPREQQKNQAGFPLLPQNPNPEGNQDKEKIFKIRHEGHEPVKKEVLPLPINQTEKSRIRGRKES